MTRIFVETELTGQTNVVLTGEAAFYLLSVLRSKRGNRFVAVDPAGRECEVVVESASSDEVRGRIITMREASAEPRAQVVLYQALLKNRNFELVLQKCTEIGVSRFVPLVTERTVPRPAGDRLEERGERWAKITEEACRQCGRNRPPEIAAALTLPAALAGFSESNAVGLIPYEGVAGSHRHALRTALAGHGAHAQVALFVGPEGGFSPSEMEQATAAGLAQVSLGPRILRAETAAIAATAVVMYELGEW